MSSSIIKDFKKFLNDIYVLKIFKVGHKKSKSITAWFKKELYK